MIKLKYYLSHLLLVWGSWHMNISSNLKNLIQIHILTLSKWVLLKSKFALKKKKMEREKKENMGNLRFLRSCDGSHFGPFDTIV